MPPEVYVPVMAYSIWLGLAGLLIVTGLRGTIIQFRTWRASKKMFAMHHDDSKAALRQCENCYCEKYHQAFNTKRKRCLECGCVLMDVGEDVEFTERYVSYLNTIHPALTREIATLLMKVEDEYDIQLYARQHRETAPLKRVEAPAQTSTPQQELNRFEWLRWMVKTKRIIP